MIPMSWIRPARKASSDTPNFSSSQMSLAHEANRYLETQAPWKSIKTDPRAAANALWVGACVISGLKTALYPFMPFSSQDVHRYLGFPGEIEQTEWKLDRPQAGQPLRKPAPLFAKIDPETVMPEMSGAGA